MSNENTSSSFYQSENQGVENFPAPLPHYQNMQVFTTQRSNTWIVLIVVLIIMGIGGGGYFYYSRTIQKKPSIVVTSQESIATLSAQLKPSTIPMETYFNETLGFKISLPSNWARKEYQEN